MDQPTASASGMPNSTSILRETIDFYKERFGLIIGVMIIPIILLAVCMGLIYATNSNFMLLAVAGIITWVVSIWSQVALIQAIKDKSITIKEAYNRTSSLVGQYWWLTLLMGLIVAGGFVLFIIPGIILAFSFCLAPYVLVDEGAMGMSALVRSRAYVTTKGAGIIGHLFFIGIIVILVSMAITAIGDTFNNETVSLVVQGIANLIVGPISTIYMYKVYRHIRKANGDQSVTASTKTKVFYTFLAILGPLLLLSIPFVVIKSLSGSGTTEQPSLGSIRANAQDAARKSDISQISSSLGLYYDDKATYPATLDVLVPQYLGTLLTDPSTKQAYAYTVGADGKTYKICATLSDATEHCESK
jgi:hypothetical protein